MLKISIVPALTINYAATYHEYLNYIQIANSAQGKENINGRFHNDDSYLQKFFHLIY